MALSCRRLWGCVRALLLVLDNCPCVFLDAVHALGCTTAARTLPIRFHRLPLLHPVSAHGSLPQEVAGWCGGAEQWIGSACPCLLFRVRLRVPSTRFPGSVFGSRESLRRFLWLGSFPPLPPPLPLCSATSSVLRAYPTSHRRGWRHCGLRPSPSRPVLVRFHRASMRSPSFRAKGFLTCAGSATARDQDMTCEYRHALCGLPLLHTASASLTRLFRGSMAGLSFPLSTLRHTPRGILRMTRGQSDSPFLLCKGLAHSTSCQLCWRFAQYAALLTPYLLHLTAL